jgi:hypothetical protein
LWPWCPPEKNIFVTSMMLSRYFGQLHEKKKLYLQSGKSAAEEDFPSGSGPWSAAEQARESSWDDDAVAAAVAEP